VVNVEMQFYGSKFINYCYQQLVDWNSKTVGITRTTINNIQFNLSNVRGAGTGVYGTAGICNPSTNTFYTNGDIVAFAASDRRLKIT
jgi:hypothetical protein